MLRDAARSLWAEPRAPDPPRRVWRDWVLVSALVPVVVLEGVFREDLVTLPENGWALIGLYNSLQGQQRTAEAAVVKHRFERAWQWADFTIVSSRKY